MTNWAPFMFCTTGSVAVSGDCRPQQIPFSEQSAWLRDRGINCFMNGNYSAQYRWCRGLLKLAQFIVDQEKEWGWVYFWQRAAPPCLLPQTTPGSEGPLFCPYQTLPSFPGHLHPLEKHTYWLILIMDLYPLMQRAMCSPERTIITTPAAFFSKDEGV